MSKQEILERLNNVLRDVFDDATLTVDEASVAGDVPGWDSLKHIYVMVAIENEFGITFELAETVELPNIGSLVDVIHSELE